MNSRKINTIMVEVGGGVMINVKLRVREHLDYTFQNAVSTITLGAMLSNAIGAN